MAVSAYFLRPKTESAANFVVFKAGETSRRLREFFVAKNDAPGAVYRAPIEGLVQDGVDNKLIRSLNYLRSFNGIPIFSPRFVEAMASSLQGEVEFYRCIVRCEGDSHDFFVGRILRRMQLLDYELSAVGSETSEFDANVLHAGINRPFLLAREQHPRKSYVLMGSSEFKAAIEGLALAIAFKSVPTHL